MMIVGLTGGIGSGKSTVASMFKKHGIPVFIADTEAKQLMQTNGNVKKAIIGAFGNEAYINNEPNTKYLAAQVFPDPAKLQALNQIIHPAVATYFKEWAAKQDAPYVIKEAAILFESGSNKDCDVIITVTAPLNVRIKRVVERDNTTMEAVQERMKHQWSESEKVKQSDYVIENIHIETTRQLVERIHSLLVKKTN
ncbi:dephospho-CoA kinase [Galbibacter pacificus]|uniref:Dephospho-CoA kinase n=1 Tax=Galbibacter pacificus TaxID=2996052 RepID=A0ABT6FRD5_9FLAO|nr:dephospho-CoA kinase [Galbibacter pacificus]MDG3581689.1 dephospho-CoA kinase [Galbibacter pacificus]MDG3585837.1 dephospho-CoA kinase [Galbibacter pacificus]